MPIVDINGTLVDFPDDMNPDQLKSAVSSVASKLSQSNTEESLVEKIKNLSGYNFSPTGLMENAVNMARKGSEKLGQFTAEQMGAKGINPYLSAAAGTAISMAPDIIMAAGTPNQNIKDVPKVANLFARRALGFQKQFLKTPFARGQAQKVAQVALENDVIPFSGNPSTMLNRAVATKSNLGREIGSILNKTPANVNMVLNDLSVLKQRLSQGASEGIMAKANPLIDDVSSSIEDLATSPTSQGITAKTLTDIKTKVSGMVNYFSDLATQTDNKAIANQLANTIRNMVKTFNSPEVYSKFIGNQKLYNAYSTMVKGLNNEVASQMSNMPISLPSAVVGTGKMVASGSPQGLAAMGLYETAKRRGAGMTAKALVDLYRSQRMAPNISSAINLLLKKRKGSE